MAGHRCQSNCSVSLNITKSTKFIFCIMLLAQAGLGIKYKYDCPKEPFIPTYLIVMGCSFLVFCCGCEKNYWIASLFFAWFIVGSVFIFKIYKPKFSPDAGKEYCNPTLYWFAFVSTICTYFLFIVLRCSFLYQRQRDDDRGVSVEV